MKTPLIEMKHIYKTYPPNVIAVNGVSLSIDEGEIHAIAGENGAGKTTLMKVLFGLEKPDSGEIYINGELVSIASPNDAIDYKIGMVHQHFMLIEDMTIADNIVLGMEPKKRGLYHYSEAVGIAQKTSEKLNLDIDVNTLISSLSVGLKQKIEIMKVLARDAKIIILDEPTAVLTPQETNELFAQLRLLRQAHYTIIIITHKLREIKALCDRVTIMKQGEMIGTYAVDTISIEEISNKMVGYEFEYITSSKKSDTKDVVLKVSNVSYHSFDKSKLHNITFDIKKGEIVGIVGVEGNGQEELARIISGQIQDYTGDVHLNDVNLQPLGVKKIRQLGVSYIPSDRLKEGSNVHGSVLTSLIALKIQEKTYRKGLFIRKKKLNAYAQSLVADYQIKTSTIDNNVGALSGGNIQKIVAAREIDHCRSLLIANNPTRGIDIGSILTLHQKINALQQQDISVLLISSDLKEIYDLSHRVLVIYEGEIVANIENIHEISEEQLGKYMLGLEKQGV